MKTRSMLTPLAVIVSLPRPHESLFRCYIPGVGKTVYDTYEDCVKGLALHGYRIKDIFDDAVDYSGEEE